MMMENLNGSMQFYAPPGAKVLAGTRIISREQADKEQKEYDDVRQKTNEKVDQYEVHINDLITRLGLKICPCDPHIFKLIVESALACMDVKVNVDNLVIDAITSFSITECKLTINYKYCNSSYSVTSKFKIDTDEYEQKTLLSGVKAVVKSILNKLLAPTPNAATLVVSSVQPKKKNNKIDNSNKKRKTTT